MATFAFNFSIEEEARKKDGSEKESKRDGRTESEKESKRDGRTESEKESKRDGRTESEKERTAVGQKHGAKITAQQDGDESHSRVSIPETHHPACEVTILPFHYKLLEGLIPYEYTVPETQTILRYLSLGKLLEFMSNSKTKAGFSDQDDSYLRTELQSFLTLSDSQHLDLVPGVYEGGMKIWECAFDLTQYLLESRIQFSGMRVLELGCGAGLPGLFALVKGAQCVHFQDYNPEVLNWLTIPNVILNTYHGNETLQQWDGNGTGPSRCRFFAGDRSDLSPLVGESPYDIILTSETIYSTHSQPKLLATMKQLLTPHSGIALVASKSYYFGVGGSVQAFLELVEHDRHFKMTECKTIESGVPRKILVLKCYSTYPILL